MAPTQLAFLLSLSRSRFLIPSGFLAILDVMPTSVVCHRFPLTRAIDVASIEPSPLRPQRRAAIRLARRQAGVPRTDRYWTSPSQLRPAKTCVKKSQDFFRRLQNCFPNFPLAERLHVISVGVVRTLQFNVVGMADDARIPLPPKSFSTLEMRAAHHDMPRFPPSHGVHAQFQISSGGYKHLSSHLQIRRMRRGSSSKFNLRTVSSTTLCFGR